MRPEEQFPLKLDLVPWFPWDLPVGARQRYTLNAPFRYISPRFGSMTAPQGLVTDFASIPRALWNVLDPEDPCILIGSTMHDAKYTDGGALDNGLHLSRSQVDQVLADIMATCGAPGWKCNAVLFAVRAFGQSHWKQ